MSEYCECGAPFIYRTHVRTGKSAPIEPVPSPRGNIRLLPEGRYEVLSPAARAQTTEPLYLNHYACCPSRGGRR
jgi:hypothetical protein